ncbi:MAG: ABC transporter permease [Acidimicrobiia bacterium]
MSAFVTHLAFELKTGVRNPTAMLLHYLFPLGFYALMGLIMLEINPLFAETMLPALVVVTLLSGTVLGLPGQLVEAREAGVYRSFFVNGVPALSIVAGPLLGAVLHSLAASMIVALTAGPIFGVATPESWPWLVAVSTLSALSFGAIAGLIGVVSAGSRATVLWSQLVFLPSMLIGGLMVDLSLLPDTMRPVSALLPSTHGMQALLGLAYRTEAVFDPVVSLAVLAAAGVLALLLSLWLFSWDRQNQTRRHSAAWAVAVVVPFLIAAVLA